MFGVSEPTGPGMGRPSGPGFTDPPLPGPESAQPAPPTLPYHRPSPPSPSRLPAVLTIVAIALVALIVVVASVWARRADVRELTPMPVPSVASAPTQASDRIEFTTSTGSGVLTIVDHGWNSDGSNTDSPGSFLTLSVQISCASGLVRYGPDSFQAFDRTGELFEAAYVPDSATALEQGTLSAGQGVTGTVAFDVPRGGVTLLMTDEGSQTVTALKVPD